MLDPCKTCTIDKAHQSNLEIHHSESNEIGKGWYIDGMKLKKTDKSKGQFISHIFFNDAY